MAWLLLFIIPVALTYVFWSVSRFGWITPSALFVMAQGLTTMSIMPLLDTEVRADFVHGCILAYATVGFCAFSYLAEDGIKPVALGPKSEYQPGAWVGAILFLSVSVTVAYFFAVGYSTFLIGIESVITGVGQDTATLRLNSYAGPRYLFPGYVNQFKNIVLPALVLMSVALWWPKRKRRLLSVALVMFAIFGLLGTGQRGAFVYFSLTALIFLILLSGRVLSGRIAVFALVALLIVLISTLALGRGREQVTQAQGVGAKGVVLLGQVGERALGSNGLGKVAGFRYVYERKHITFGREWVQTFEGLTPFSRGSTLANEIFAVLYGSMRGNSPPSLWASTYHNFGAPGVALMPPFLALLFGRLARQREQAKRSRHPLTFMGIAGVTVVLGMWIANGPVTPFITGIVPYGAMWWFGERLARRGLSEDQAKPGRPLGERRSSRVGPKLEDRS